MPDMDLLSVLPYIPPSELNYQDWVNVGMALKEAGYTWQDWDDWSRLDLLRYHSGECRRKWDSFHGSASPITGATIVQMAKDRGWRPQSDDGPGYELGWDDIIGSRDGVLVDQGWLEGKEVREPEIWDPVKDLTKYLEVLFEASENVGYVTESWERDGKHFPSKGLCDRTAGELIEQLNKYQNIADVFGDYNPQVGAWIRFNPLDGKGVKNENVTDYRYALVESDCMELEQQHALIQELELPVACLVYSGGKSIHAIVKIEAANYEEYRKRVDYLYNVLKKNGLPVDTQNKNPSRLSRMPGVTRNGHKQFLMATNIGKTGFKEWQEWIETVTDELPNPEGLEDVWDNLPELAPPLIDGVLRQGHKMLIAGPSKAGKSYSLIELTCAIAEGKDWMGWKCSQGRVMYVNLELDRASCLHRFKDIYTAMGWEPRYIRNIDIWNLRGKSVPMDKLAPKLIRRASKKNYIAIIIDPIYKIITGDENSADQMAQFCNQFDLVCTELGCAVIYCHHHSKGGQGQKRSMDRASGSGVFARDPDALIDMIQLEVPETVYQTELDKEIIRLCIRYLDKYAMYWRDDVSQDDMCVARIMREVCSRRLSAPVYAQLVQDISAAEKAVHSRTAWRVEGTLREFPKFSPVNMWFDYPRHRIDDSGILGDLASDGEQPPWRKAANKNKNRLESERRSKATEFEDAVQNCNMGEPPTINDLAQWYSSSGKNVDNRTIRNWVKKFGFYIDKNTGKVLKLEK